jgi:Domain of unknown function (DUF4252)
MTKIMQAVQVVLAMAMVSGSMATAQQLTLESGANVASLDLQVSGLKLQTNVAMNVAYQAKDDLFAGAEKFAQGASEVTEINLDPTTMGLIGKRYGRGGDETSKMKSMSIHTYKYDKPGMFKMDDVEAYRKKLENGSWNCPIRVRTQTGSSDICSRADADQVNEMVIMTIEPQKLTFIHISGKMSLDELNDMSGTANEFRPRVNLPRGPMPPTPPTIIMTKPGAEMKMYKDVKPKGPAVPDAAPAATAAPAPRATPNQ